MTRDRRLQLRSPSQRWPRLALSRRFPSVCGRRGAIDQLNPRVCQSHDKGSWYAVAKYGQLLTAGGCANSRWAPLRPDRSLFPGRGRQPAVSTDCNIGGCWRSKPRHCSASAILAGSEADRNTFARIYADASSASTSCRRVWTQSSSVRPKARVPLQRPARTIYARAHSWISPKRCSGERRLAQDVRPNASMERLVGPNRSVSRISSSPGARLCFGNGSSPSPRLGTYALHRGICPEYRDAHGCFRAMAQGDHDNVGTTLLRVDAGVDTGPVFGYFPWMRTLANRTSRFSIARFSTTSMRSGTRGERLTRAAPCRSRPVDGGPLRGQPWLTVLLRMRARERCDGGGRLRSERVPSWAPWCTTTSLRPEPRRRAASPAGRDGVLYKAIAAQFDPHLDAILHWAARTASGFVSTFDDGGYRRDRSRWTPRAARAGG